MFQTICKNEKLWDHYSFALCRDQREDGKKENKLRERPLFEKKLLF